MGAVTHVPVYVSDDEPEYAVLVADADVTEARKAVQHEVMSGLPIHYLGIRTVPIRMEEGQRGRRRRAHVFTDEPQ